MKRFSRFSCIASQKADLRQGRFVRLDYEASDQDVHELVTMCDGLTSTAFRIVIDIRVIGGSRLGVLKRGNKGARFDPIWLHNQPRCIIIGPIPSAANPLRPSASAVTRVHLPPRPDPPGPAPPCSSGVAGVRTSSLPCQAVFTREGKRRELTEDDHERKNVNPVLLKETLLWFGRDDLTFGCKRWRRAQLWPRVAFD